MAKLDDLLKLEQGQAIRDKKTEKVYFLERPPREHEGGGVAFSTNEGSKSYATHELYKLTIYEPVCN